MHQIATGVQRDHHACKWHSISAKGERVEVVMAEQGGVAAIGSVIPRRRSKRDTEDIRERERARNR